MPARARARARAHARVLTLAAAGGDRATSFSDVYRPRSIYICPSTDDARFNAKFSTARAVSSFACFIPRHPPPRPLLRKDGGDSSRSDTTRNIVFYTKLLLHYYRHFSLLPSVVLAHLREPAPSPRPSACKVTIGRREPRTAILYTSKIF